MKTFIDPITLVSTCPLCGHVSEITVEMDDYLEWVFNDKPVVTIFPYLSANEREILISGICPSCWEVIYASYDEE